MDGRSEYSQQTIDKLTRFLTEPGERTRPGDRPYCAVRTVDNRKTVVVRPRVSSNPESTGCLLAPFAWLWPKRIR